MRERVRRSRGGPGNGPWFWVLLGLLFLVLLGGRSYGRVRGGFSPGKAGFSLRFKDIVSSYQVLGVYLLPGEALDIEALPSAPGDQFMMSAPKERSNQISPGKWSWKAPRERGLYPLRISSRRSGDSILLNVFVMVPRRVMRGNTIKGYRIGSYPQKPFRGKELFSPPGGFIEVSKRNMDTYLSPHFTLKQFLCKQGGEFPKYVVLNERLLIKLERVLEELNRRGHRADTLEILSGFRTPLYNKSIGNVKYSMHQFGLAADIFIDVEPRDNMMDDLNGDGRVDIRDTRVICDVIEYLEKGSLSGKMIGGLGRYGRTRSHGPFVHVDVRGYPVRW